MSETVTTADGLDIIGLHVHYAPKRRGVIIESRLTADGWVVRLNTTKGRFEVMLSSCTRAPKAPDVTSMPVRFI